MYEIFEALLKRRGITAYKFCKETGVSSSTISTWKKKNSIARPELAKIVCEYFGITLDYLMTGEEKEEQPYYLDDEARQMAEELAHNPNLHILFDAARTISKEDLQFVVDMVNRLKKENE